MPPSKSFIFFARMRLFFLPPLTHLLDFALMSVLFTAIAVVVSVDSEFFAAPFASAYFGRVVYSPTRTTGDAVALRPAFVAETPRIPTRERLAATFARQFLEHVHSSGKVNSVLPSR